MENTAKKKHIFILSGQSNMSGRGGVTKNTDQDPPKKSWNGVVPAEFEPHHSILRFNANLEWEPAQECIHVDIDDKKVCGVGPAMSFANVVRRRLDGALGLVPCAVGGTAIKEWARGEALYENMVKRVKESVKNGNNEIKALLWFQGESDTSTAQDSESYRVNMETFIRDLRRDLNLPSLPIIQVALASGFEYIEKVREAQKAIDLPNVVCVDAKGMSLGADNLHLTTESQVQLGQMLAEAYLSHFHAS